MERFESMLVAALIVGWLVAPPPAYADEPETIAIAPEPAMSALPTAEYARNQAELQVGEVDAHTHQYASLLREFERSQDRIADLRRQIEKLIAERDRVLHDLRTGMFCSKCHRSRTEFEIKGENFFRHLENVSARAVSEEPEKIRAKEEEYNRRIAGRQDDLAKLKAAAQENAQSREKIANNIRDAVYLWRMAISLEEGLISYHIDRALDVEKAQIQSLKRDLRACTRREANGPSELCAPQRTLLASLEEAAHRRIDARWTELTIAEQHRDADYARLRECEARMKSEKFAWTTPSIEISVARVTAYVTPSRVGFSSSHFGVKAKLETYNDAGSAGSEAFIEVFNYAFGVGYSTRYTAKGPKSGNYIILGRREPLGARSKIKLQPLVHEEREKPTFRLPLPKLPSPTRRR